MTKSYNQLVVHAGQAHRDDFIATCIALALFPAIAYVFRRDPTSEELEDPDCLVLDVGGRHEPERGNFDHHQMERNAPPACALSLFLEYLDLDKKFMLMPWYVSTKIMDSKGPFALATHLGCQPDAIFKNLSPIEGAVVTMFEEVDYLLDNKSTLMRLLQGLGNRFLEHAEELWSQLEWLTANAKMVDICGVPAMVIESTNTKATQQFRDTRCPGVGICISWDDRGGGWSLYRFNDHPQVDFSRLEGRPAVVFAHKSGFIAKTAERLPLSDILTLCELAVFTDEHDPRDRR